MRILISNDDGIASEGLRALAAEFSKAHEVYIAAPWHEQSGMAHALNVHRPIEVEEMPGVALELGAVAAWRIAGTPTDSVKLFLEALMDPNRPIDLVLSGINRGANLATDVLYSGTVGAAMEGFLHDLHAAAISLDIDADYPYTLAAELVRPFLERAVDGAAAPQFLNVNFPQRLASIEFAMSRLGKRDYENAFQQDARDDGRIFYTVAGKIVDSDNGPHTDLYTVEHGGISVTPLHADLTDYAAIEESRSEESASF
ncbi:5'/3'-nucleotidase SurE [uncultured Selenomonas sp.]|uniref:5'/3'-nucleotidase SurE n=1 Tax=uncultured Selenomonas sp. TaxID=159275 RepID=UPI0025D992B8|nr:5'/3'-nucleotidase SurE [uncultured Selenomonas sp.]